MRQDIYSIFFCRTTEWPLIEFDERFADLYIIGARQAVTPFLCMRSQDTVSARNWCTNNFSYFCSFRNLSHYFSFFLFLTWLVHLHKLAEGCNFAREVGGIHKRGKEARASVRRLSGGIILSLGYWFRFIFFVTASLIRFTSFYYKTISRISSKCCWDEMWNTFRVRRY